MLEYVEEIVERRKRGWALTTLNGTHDWVLDNGVKPSIHIQLDARLWNERFVRNPVDSCRYVLSSQTPPELFDRLKSNDVTIWHAGRGIRKPILDKYYNQRWMLSVGGSTVGTHAISILHTLGFRKIAIYGMDSCLRKGAHHAFSQPENNSKSIWKVRAGRRTFWTHAWMIQQVDDLIQMLPMIPDDLDLDFRGDNLVTHIIHETAKHGNPPNISILEKRKS